MNTPRDRQHTRDRDGGKAPARLYPEPEDARERYLAAAQVRARSVIMLAISDRQREAVRAGVLAWMMGQTNPLLKGNNHGL